MLEDLRIRRIRPGDAAGIAQIEAAVTYAGGRCDFGPIFRHPIKNAEHVSLVAEQDGKSSAT